MFGIKINLVRDQQGTAIQALRPVSGSGVEIDGTAASAQSAALDAKCVRIFAESDITIEFGLNPTALTTSMKMASGSAEYFSFTPGNKVAIKGGKAQITIMQ